METLRDTPTLVALRRHKSSCALCLNESAAGLRGTNRTCADVAPLIVAWRKAEKRNRAARARREVYASLGMSRVKGALGGIYYE